MHFGTKRIFRGNTTPFPAFRVSAFALLLSIAFIASHNAAAQTVLYEENFESGIVPASWSVPSSADAGWNITNITAQEGIYSLQSGSVANFNEPEISFSITVPSYARLDFFHYWNAFNGSPLRVYVNNTEEYYAVSPRGWFPASIELTAGTHVIRFHFDRNSGAQGCNCVRIDNLSIVSEDDDLDGMKNQWELDNGLNPADPNDATLDADGDGLNNLGEFNQGTDPNSADTDNDGLTDQDELLTHFTDPLSADSDGDEMPDGWEVSNGLNPLDPTDDTEDPDNDNLNNVGEYRLGYDPQDALSVPPVTLSYDEGFEGGVIPAGWTVPTVNDGSWYVEAVSANSGVYSLRSDKLKKNASEEARIVLPIFVEDSDFSFSHYWNTGNNDYLRVYLNGYQIYTAGAGTPRGWIDTPVFDLPAGYNEIEFVYDQNINTNQGCRCVRIDDIHIVTKDSDQDGMPDAWEIANGLNPASDDSALDFDSDGLTNLEEYILGTEPDLSDSDGDSLSDGDEVNTHATDPLAPDTDLDNMPDGWEITNGLDPLDPADAALDTDGDMLNNLGEYRLGYDPNNAASVPPLTTSYSEDFEGGVVPAAFQGSADADAGWKITSVTAHNGTYSLQNESIGNNASAEIVLPLFTSLSELSLWHYWNAESAQDRFKVYVNDEVIYDITSPRGWFPVTLLLKAGYNEIVFAYETDFSGKDGCDCVRIDEITINNIDLDFDNMPDQWELDNGLNPADPADALLDADGDGLNNVGEYENGTDPNNADTDADSLSDGDEVNVIGSNPLNADTDGDELPDDWEYNNGLDPTDAGDALLDADGDGLNNKGEFVLGFDPQNAASVPIPVRSQIKNFENGNVPNVWTVPAGAEAGWEVTSDDPQQGNYALRSEPIGSSQKAQIKYAWYFDDTELQFNYRRSSFSSAHRFYLYLDGVLVFSDISSNYEWKESPIIPMSAGYHEIVWSFESFTSTAYPCTCVDIDNVTITLGDGDNDGIPDRYEWINGLSPMNAADALLDIDGDGLTALQEYQQGTDHTESDTDNDGANDGDEINVHGTDPLNADSDADDMPDGWEIDNGLDPLDAVDASVDTDGDMLQNIGEYNLGFDPNDAFSVPPLDTGYLENFESGVLGSRWIVPADADAGWSISTITANSGIYSLQSDAVGGGETAASVVQLFAEASTLQFQRYWNAYASNPLAIYLNGDLVYSVDTPRAWEYGPLIDLPPGYNQIKFLYRRTVTGGWESGCSCVRIDDLQLISRDVDLDGMLDAWELIYGLDPADPADAALDLDGDGLINLEEFRLGTDVLAADSDSDTVSDGDEVNVYGSDPLNTDTDGDQMPDGYEVDNGLDPTNAADAYDDADSDGLNNLGEFRLGYDPQDAGSVPTPISSFFEGFESGVYPTGVNWNVPADSDADWRVKDTTQHSGTYNLQSGNINYSETSQITLGLYSGDTLLSFWHYWNAHWTAPLEVYVNGVQAYSANSPRGWFPSALIPLSQGYNEITFVYVENSFTGQGCNCVRIDDITLIPN
jgi:pseudolysin